MKGLLIKDLEWLKTLRTVLLIYTLLAVFYLFGSLYLFGMMFLPVCIELIIVKSIMKDLQQDTVNAVFSLPFTRSDYVNEKYLISIGSGALCSLVYGMLIVLVRQEPLPQVLVSIYQTTVLAAVVAAIMIPLTIVFKENARIVLMMIVLAVVLTGMDLVKIPVNTLLPLLNPAFLLALSVSVLALSYVISQRIFQKISL